MAWCEANGVDYLFGLARNERLVGRDRQPNWPRRRAEAERTGKPARRFKDFTWSHAQELEPQPPRRRAKRNGPRGEANPRFVVTSLTREEPRPATSTRKSTAPAARWRTASRSASSISSPTAPRPKPCAPTSFACGSPRWPMCWSRAPPHRPQHTQFANATCGTIRLKLLKIGALVTHQRAPHQDRHGLGLPLSPRVRPRPRLCQLAARRALTNQTPHSRHRPDQTARARLPRSCPKITNIVSN